MDLIKISSGKLYKGGMPTQEELASDKFDIIWNLAKELKVLFEIESKYAQTVLLADIDDYDAPADLNKFKFQLNMVINCLKNNGTVLVHCLGGHGRTGMAIACIKHYVDGMSIDECLKFALKTCKGPEDKKQILFVKNIDMLFGRPIA